MKLQNTKKIKDISNGFEYSPRMVVGMSFPIFIELFLQMLVGNIDQIMISRYSQESVAAIGIGNQIMNIIVIIVSVTCAATTIVVSRYLGEGSSKAEIAETSNASVVIAGVIGIACTVMIVGFHKQIFHLLNVPDEILGETGRYLIIVGSFIVVQGLYGALSSVVRAYGFMKEIMIVSAIMNIANIIGNAILINGLWIFPQMGITGAAISTNFSKLFGLVLMYMLFRRRIGVKFSPASIKKVSKAAYLKLLRIGIPSAGESFSYCLSQIVILGFINTLGTAVIDTKVYCSMFANVAYLFSTAVSQAAQVAIGYLIGSRQLDKVNKCIWDTIVLSLIVSVSITVIIWHFADFAFGLFTDDESVITLGKSIMFIEIFLEIGRSFNITMARNLVSIGDIMFPIVLCIIVAWGISVFGGYILGITLGYGLVGMWIMMAGDELGRAVVFTIRLKSNVWRKKHNF